MSKFSDDHVSSNGESVGYFIKAGAIPVSIITALGLFIVTIMILVFNFRITDAIYNDFPNGEEDFKDVQQLRGWIWMGWAFFLIINYIFFYGTISIFTGGIVAFFEKSNIKGGVMLLLSICLCVFLGFQIWALVLIYKSIDQLSRCVPVTLTDDIKNKLGNDLTKKILFCEDASTYISKGNKKHAFGYMAFCTTVVICASFLVPFVSKDRLGNDKS